MGMAAAVAVMITGTIIMTMSLMTKKIAQRRGAVAADFYRSK